MGVGSGAQVLQGLRGQRQEMGPGTVRNLPGFNSDLAAFVPHGSVVEVGRSTVKDGQTWYLVRAERNGKIYEG